MPKLKIRLSIYLIFCFTALLHPLIVSGQQANTKRVCDTIRFEFIEEKIIIPVTVNGKASRYIVDTGGTTCTVRSSAVEMGSMSTGMNTSISDLNKQSASYERAVLSEVQLSPNYKLNRLESLILPSNGFFKSLEVDGLFGGDAFTGCVLTFDFREGIMVINHPYRPTGLKVTDGTELFLESGSRSLVNADMGGTEVKVLFDTGAHGMLKLSRNDYAKLNGGPAMDLIAEGVGISGVGIVGPGHPTQMKKVNLHRLDFAGKVFTNVGSVTTPMELSIIGVDVLRYGKVVIDYMRRRFYFFPYEDGEKDMKGAPVIWEVGVLPVKDHFEIVTVWQSASGKVNLGEHVVEINGIDLSEFPLSEPELNRLMDGITGDETYIVVIRNDMKVKVEIRKR